jgi:hypothetical protein
MPPPDDDLDADTIAVASVPVGAPEVRAAVVSDDTVGRPTRAVVHVPTPAPAPLAYAPPPHPVVALGETPPMSSPSPQTPGSPSPTPHEQRRLIILVSLLLVVLCTAMGAYVLWRGPVAKSGHPAER